MNVKISKTNASLDFFNSRLDEVRMSGHERLKAKARLAQAEAVADALFGAFGGVRRLLRRLTASPPTRRRRPHRRPDERLPAARCPAVAVQRLNPRHRDDIARHLLQLPAEDRRLRFGQPFRDDAVRDYVAGIDFERDRVFGIHGADAGTHRRRAPCARSRRTVSPSWA